MDRGSDDKSSVRSEDGWDLDDSILMWVVCATSCAVASNKNKTAALCLL